MIAELHNKISQNGTNLSDKLEDQLTGDVFGNLRYLPFSNALAPLMKAVAFVNQDSQLIQFFDDKVQTVLDYEASFHFWPKREQGEIDLILETDQMVIGIEVKYLSGLSSEDDVDNGNQEDWRQSDNQLARYVQILKDWHSDKQAILIFLAPTSLGLLTYHNVLTRKLIVDDVLFGLLTWENVLTVFMQLDRDHLQKGQALIIEDLIQLLVKKKFQRFDGFDIIGPVIIANQYYKIENPISYSKMVIHEEEFYQYGI